MLARSECLSLTGVLDRRGCLLLGLCVVVKSNGAPPLDKCPALRGDRGDDGAGELPPRPTDGSLSRDDGLCDVIGVMLMGGMLRCGCGCGWG